MGSGPSISDRWALSERPPLLIFTGALIVTSCSALWWDGPGAWRTPESLEASSFGSTATDPDRLFFSLIVPEPADEEKVLETTLEHLASMAYPRFEVLVVVGHDDPGTAEVAQTRGQSAPRALPRLGRPS